MSKFWTVFERWKKFPGFLLDKALGTTSTVVDMGAPSWPSGVAMIVRKYLGDVPAWLALGWISVESGGRLDESTTSVFPEGENGYFQLSPEESADVGVDHASLLVDPDLSIRAGLYLIERYSKKLRTRSDLDYDTDTFWRLVKLEHSMGSGATEKFIDSAKSAGVSINDWDALRDYGKENEGTLLSLLRHSPTKWIGNVDRVYDKGRILAATVGLESGSIGIGLLILVALVSAAVYFATRGA